MKEKAIPVEDIYYISYKDPNQFDDEQDYVDFFIMINEYNGVQSQEKEKQIRR